MRQAIMAILMAAGVMTLLVGSPTLDAAPAQPQSGGTLVFGYILRPRSLDPNIWTGTSDNMVMRQIFDPLIWSPRPGFYQPGLATSWQISPDGKVYTFRLRRDVKFHDGTPFNAAAVKFMFDRIADPRSRSLQTPAIGPYDQSEVVDEFTVRVVLKEPFAPLMANLAGTVLSPASPTAVQRLGERYAQSPVATGPFMFEKWEGNDLYLVRNPDYRWAPAFLDHKGPAYVERLIFRAVPEAATRMIALQRGEVTAIHFPVLDQVEQFRRNRDFTVHRIDTPGHPKSMPINTKAAPTDDLRVRQAILYGIDRQKVVDLVQFGNAKVANGPFTKVTPYYNPAVERMYAYNPKKAVELLEAAGWRPGRDGVRQKAGQRLRLQLIMFTSGPNQQLAEVIQAMLRDLGFDATLDISGYDAYAKRITENDYNVAEINFTGLDPNVPAFLMYHSSQITGGGQFNRTRVADAKLDAMIEEGLHSNDVRRRKAAYEQFQTFVMENALTLPVWDNSWITIAQRSVQGLRFDLEGRWLFYTVWLAR